MYGHGGNPNNPPNGQQQGAPGGPPGVGAPGIPGVGVPRYPSQYGFGGGVPHPSQVQQGHPSQQQQQQQHPWFGERGPAPPPHAPGPYPVGAHLSGFNGYAVAPPVAAMFGRHPQSGPSAQQQQQQQQQQRGVVGPPQQQQRPGLVRTSSRGRSGGGKGQQESRVQSGPMCPDLSRTFSQERPQSSIPKDRPSSAMGKDKIQMLSSKERASLERSASKERASKERAAGKERAVKERAAGKERASKERASRERAASSKERASKERQATLTPLRRGPPSPLPHSKPSTPRRRANAAPASPVARVQSPPPLGRNSLSPPDAARATRTRRTASPGPRRATSAEGKGVRRATSAEGGRVPAEARAGARRGASGKESATGFVPGPVRAVSSAQPQPPAKPQRRMSEREEFEACFPLAKRRRSGAGGAVKGSGPAGAKADGGDAGDTTEEEDPPVATAVEKRRTAPVTGGVPSFRLTKKAGTNLQRRRLRSKQHRKKARAERRSQKNKTAGPIFALVDEQQIPHYEQFSLLDDDLYDLDMAFWAESHDDRTSPEIRSPSPPPEGEATRDADPPASQKFRLPIRGEEGYEEAKHIEAQVREKFRAHAQLFQKHKEKAWRDLHKRQHTQKEDLKKTLADTVRKQKEEGSVAMGKLQQAAQMDRGEERRAELVKRAKALKEREKEKLRQFTKRYEGALLNLENHHEIRRNELTEFLRKHQVQFKMQQEQKHQELVKRHIKRMAEKREAEQAAAVESRPPGPAGGRSTAGETRRTAASQHVPRGPVITEKDFIRHSGAALRYERRKIVTGNTPSNLAVEIHNEGLILRVSRSAGAKSKGKEAEAAGKGKGATDPKKAAADEVNRVEFISAGMKARDLLYSICCGEVPRGISTTIKNMNRDSALPGGQIKCTVTDLRTSDDTATAHRALAVREIELTKIRNKLVIYESKIKEIKTKKEQTDKNREAALMEESECTSRLKKSNSEYEHARRVRIDYSNKNCKMSDTLVKQIENVEKRKKSCEMNYMNAHKRASIERRTTKGMEKILMQVEKKKAKTEGDYKDTKEGKKLRPKSSQFSESECASRVGEVMNILKLTVDRRRRHLAQKQKNLIKILDQSDASFTDVEKTSIGQRLLRRCFSIVLRPPLDMIVGDMQGTLAVDERFKDRAVGTAACGLSPALRAEQILLLSLHPESPSPPLPPVPSSSIQPWAEPGWHVYLNTSRSRDDAGRPTILPCTPRIDEVFLRAYSEYCSAPTHQITMLLKKQHLRLLSVPISKMGQASAPAEVEIRSKEIPEVLRHLDPLHPPEVPDSGYSFCLPPTPKDVPSSTTASTSPNQSAAVGSSQPTESGKRKSSSISSSHQSTKKADVRQLERSMSSSSQQKHQQQQQQQQHLQQQQPHQQQQQPHQQQHQHQQHQHQQHQHQSTSRSRGSGSGHQGVKSSSSRRERDISPLPFSRGSKGDMAIPEMSMFSSSSSSSRQQQKHHHQQQLHQQQQQQQQQQHKQQQQQQQQQQQHHRHHHQQQQQQQQQQQRQQQRQQRKNSRSSPPMSESFIDVLPPSNMDHSISSGPNLDMDDSNDPLLMFLDCL